MHSSRRCCRQLLTLRKCRALLLLVVVPMLVLVLVLLVVEVVVVVVVEVTECGISIGSWFVHCYHTSTDELKWK
jgi:hypothetical protein